MKVKKLIELCDICQRNGYLIKCLVCGREVCLMCKADLGNPYNAGVCKKCEEHPKVNKILQKSLSNWRNNNTRLDKKLMKLKIRRAK